jgi:phage baseplate assembly protein gpV
MASLSREDLEILRIALSIWHKKQPFERAVGAAVRQRDGAFLDYQRLMEALRVEARKLKGSTDQAAENLLSEQEP